MTDRLQEIRALPPRLAAKIDVNPGTGCWEWNAALHKGYGQVRWNGKTSSAHRVVFTLLAQPIPDGLTLDHLCRVTRCVNPAHLDPCTIRENSLRAEGAVIARNLAATECPAGHPLSGPNVYLRPDGKGRECRDCRRVRVRESKRRRRDRKRAAALAAVLPTEPPTQGAES